ncbi:MAG: secretin and TonB N-terminal domain-containing protein, partial [Desulfobacula sp.]|nr:secretin and TonB N-terminal domain-containing protein [Desulfobacula sp.]
MKTDYRIIKYVLIILLLFFLGCAAKEKKPEEKTFSGYEKWKKLAEYTQAYSPSPRDINTQEYKQKTKSEHLTEVQAPVNKKEKKHGAVPKKNLPSIMVSMQMHDVDVGVLFRALAKAADVNIILNKTITGKASLNIKQVPWNQVFKGLLNTYGYTYVWMEDIIRVVSIGDLKTQASLMDAKQMMELKNKEHDIALMTLTSEKENLEPLQTRVVHVDYANPMELRNNLWEFLKVSKSGYQEKTGKEESSDQDRIRGSILVDTHTNSLMIQATSNDMISILELMEKLDKPTPQVRIEAFIVETTSETARELGMQWGGLFKTGNGYTKIISGPGLEDVEENIADVILTGGGLKVGNIATYFDEHLLNIQLSALQEEGKLNILSSPSITTLDNQKAIIESGREIPYVSYNDGENTVEFKKAVLKLEATPHVIDGNNLKIKITTNKDELDFSN